MNNSFKDNNIFDKNKIIEPSNEYIKKELDYNPFFYLFNFINISCISIS